MTAVRRERFVLAGVGGQGVLVAAHALSRAFMIMGDYVKQAEIHGMAQRGGSVICFVRRGRVVHSPLIDPGRADVVLALERLEAVRYSHYLSPGGLMVASSRLIPPVGMDARQLETEVGDGQSEIAPGREVLWVDAHGESLAVGNPRTANSILIGSLSAFLDVPVDAWEQAVTETVPPRTVDINMAAFRRGRNLAGGL